MERIQLQPQPFRSHKDLKGHPEMLGRSAPKDPWVHKANQVTVALSAHRAPREESAQQALKGR